MHAGHENWSGSRQEVIELSRCKDDLAAPFHSSMQGKGYDQLQKISLVVY